MLILLRLQYHLADYDQSHSYIYINNHTATYWLFQPTIGEYFGILGQIHLVVPQSVWSLSVDVMKTL